MERMASYSSRWTKVVKELVPETTLAVTDLEKGTEYKFRVSAQNEAGVSEPCEPISIIAKDPYGTYCSYYIYYLLPVYRI